MIIKLTSNYFLLEILIKLEKAIKSNIIFFIVLVECTTNTKLKALQKSAAISRLSANATITNSNLEMREYFTQCVLFSISLHKS